MVSQKYINDSIYSMLLHYANNKGLELGFMRADYDSDGIVITPVSLDGDEALRRGRTNVNIFVKDIPFSNGKHTMYAPNHVRIDEITDGVINILSNHSDGYNSVYWTIGAMSGIVESDGQKEHIKSIPLEIVIHEHNRNQK